MLKNNIITQTVQMLSPNVNSKRTRVSFSLTEKDIEIINKEAYLRQQFYSDEKDKNDLAFYNDYDMQSHYFLAVCYEEILNIPLLSSRYYYDKNAIRTAILGDKKQITFRRPYSLNWLLNQHSFLLDRISVNHNNQIFHQNEGKIFNSFNKEFAIKNPNALLLFLAEMYNNEKNLSTYQSLGFSQIGATVTNAVPYWILLNDLRNITPET